MQQLPASMAFRSQAAAALLVSAAAYGTQVDGLSPIVAAGLRRAVQRAFNRGNAARCAIEADLAFGGDSARLDPAEASVLAALLAWARLVASNPQRLALARQAWRQAAEKGESLIGGPITATLAALRRLGWSQEGSVVWRDRSGQLVSLTDIAGLRDKIHADSRFGE